MTKEFYHYTSTETLIEEISNILKDKVNKGIQIKKILVSAPLYTFLSHGKKHNEIILLNGCEVCCDLTIKEGTFAMETELASVLCEYDETPAVYEKEEVAPYRIAYRITFNEYAAIDREEIYAASLWTVTEDSIFVTFYEDDKRQFALVPLKWVYSMVPYRVKDESEN